MQALYYSQHLYPFQDRILALVNRLDLGFYLTGGTALSRHYMQHRYSDDLVLFVNNSKDFKGLVNQVEDILQLEGIKYNVPTRGNDFVRMEAFGVNETRLIIDLVNDRVMHIGGFEASGQLGKVDNIINILSNLEKMAYFFIGLDKGLCLFPSIKIQYEQVMDYRFCPFNINGSMWHLAWTCLEFHALGHLAWSRDKYVSDLE